MFNNLFLQQGYKGGLQRDIDKDGQFIDKKQNLFLTKSTVEGLQECTRQDDVMAVLDEVEKNFEKILV